MRRQEVSFPLAFRLFLPAHLHRTIRAVFGPVGVGSKRSPADGAAFDLVPAFGDLGAQGRVQRQDGHLEPPAQQRIGNTLHTDTFLPIVQQEAVSVTVVAALMGEPAGLAVLGITHSRYVHRSCVCSFPGAVRKMLSTFCLTMPYSFNFCFASLYCADSRCRSASSFLYSVLRAYRLGSFVTPASLSAFAAASYKISWLSCCRRNAALSLAFRSSSATGRSCL